MAREAERYGFWRIAIDRTPVSDSPYNEALHLSVSLRGAASERQGVRQRRSNSN